MNDFRDQMLAGRISRSTIGWKTRIARTDEGIAAMLSSCSRPYVSLSFGKQSICLAHLVYAVAPRTEMHFLASDETWSMFDYRKVIDSFCERWPINLTIHQTHRYFDAATWKDSRDAGDRDLQKMCSRADYDGVFMGLSKDESRARKLTCIANNSGIHPHIFRYADGTLRCTPLQDWGLIDLAAYIDLHDIPLLNVYKKFGLQQRTTARITKKARDFGSAELLRCTNSVGHRSLVNSHPEIAQ